MRFSISLPYPSGGNDPAEVDGYLEVARAVESAGLDAVWVTDHPFPYVEKGKAGHQAIDPFVLLGFVAAATERVGLHVNLIVLPYRNPFLTARLLGTVDVVSRGRAIAAVGAGYMRREFDALGADFERRAALVEEGVAAMRAAWTGEPVRFEGEGYRADGNVMLPRPVTSPQPPLWRGGNSRQAIESAARSFDGWAPFEVTAARSRDTTTSPMDLDVLPGKIALLREAAEREGRSEPLDVCLCRPFPRWLTDRSQAIEELQALAAMGVTWLAPQLAGRDAAEQVESVAAFAEVVRHAGVAPNASG
ncbi:MAG: TIGR03619 family F420-dependent LLM class oxidoreductase [Actinobacteria bacterium]|nr:TIGR03619 family F420-dependent LLM class oxidoreductase [Actinomycetota bacterium]